MPQYDLKFNSGDTKIIEIVVRNSNNDLQDITGATIKYQIAKHVNSNTVFLQKSTGNGITLTDANNGTFQITISPQDTDSLGGKDCYHECEITLVDGTVQTLFGGECIINKTLIRSA